MKGWETSVKYLIEKDKADPFVKVNNISPVEQTVIQDQLEIVDYLVLSSNVSLHIPSGIYGGGRTYEKEQSEGWCKLFFPNGYD